MNSTTFIHSSDLQIGMQRWFLGEEQSVFDDSRLRAIHKLGGLATQHNAEFIVLAGDTFEHNALSERVRQRGLDALSSLPVPVYILPGNHDPLTADSIFRTIQQQGSMWVINSSEPMEVRPGLEIVGAPWFSKAPGSDLVQAAFEPLSAPAGNVIRIGVAHGQVESFGGESPALIDLERAETTLADGHLDYLALGDSHSAARVSSAQHIWYSGSPETTDYAEENDKGEFNSGKALVVQIEKDATQTKVEVTPAEIGEWTFDAITAGLYSQEDVDAFLARIQSYPAKNYTCIKYALNGAIDIASMQALEEGLSDLSGPFVNLYERERISSLSVVPTEEEISDLQLGGVAGATLAELLEDGEDPVARDAVSLLFRLSQEA